MKYSFLPCVKRYLYPPALFLAQRIDPFAPERLRQRKTKILNLFEEAGDPFSLPQNLPCQWLSLFLPKVPVTSLERPRVLRVHRQPLPLEINANLKFIK